VQSNDSELGRRWQPLPAIFMGVRGGSGTVWQGNAAL